MIFLILYLLNYDPMPTWLVPKEANRATFLSKSGNFLALLIEERILREAFDLIHIALFKQTGGIFTPPERLVTKCRTFFTWESNSVVV